MKNIHVILWSVFSVLLIFCTVFSQSNDRTCFQTAQPWKPELDLRSDIAIVYGVNKTFSDRVKSWQEKGYRVEFMTGSAWGEYQDYFDGRFDGKTHYEEGQVQKDGETIWHGPSVPYVVPTKSFLEYLKSHIKIAINEGVQGIHLEEPEFWNRAGYSEGFKKEWQEYYGESWQAQHESPAATYRSNKLKYYLYTRALTELIQFTKEYAKQQGKTIPCYVPTHSLINYSIWNIVSPEASLALIPGLDGYIGQVWTGTARTPLYYNGIHKERTFEAAYLEYGSVAAMTGPTGKRTYFLTDPIEDNPEHTWEDYKYNYEATFIAQLLHPGVSHYEVMPWPGRIFLRKYSTENEKEKKSIPQNYATEILVLINALNNMNQDEAKSEGTKGIAVLQSNTLMFQSYPTHKRYEDPALSNFYGMALPLLKHGLPVQTVQMEHLEKPQTLDGINVLLMSYANMKPLKASYHKTIALWVKNGGALIYIGRDNDPYQNVPEWWNTKPNQFEAPSHHLFHSLNTDIPKQSTEFRFGKGYVMVLRQNPKEFILEKKAHVELRDKVLLMLERIDKADFWLEKNYFHMRRGPYEIISVLEESVSDNPYTVTGRLVDLFNANLPVLYKVQMKPGQRGLLYNLDFVPSSKPYVIASASRVTDEKMIDGKFKFCLKGPKGTMGNTRVYFPQKPGKILVKDVDGNFCGKISDWDSKSQTILISYPNKPEGIWIKADVQITKNK
jgi:hypothetical protein